MDDFNADNAKIDAALAGKTELFTGSYTGDGTATRVIHLGFTPKAIVLTSSNGIFNTTAAIYGGLVLRLLAPTPMRSRALITLSF